MNFEGLIEGLLTPDRLAPDEPDLERLAEGIVLGDGGYIVELEPFADERGYFARAWCAEEMAEAGVVSEISQINMSSSIRVGTIRGLHWRPMTHPEAKFLRCIAGRVFDVCVDIRQESPTFLQWVGV